MPIPRVAIVGRPNVGKSSLMNMVAGGKVSIVDPTPGVTRDRVSSIVELEPPFKGRDPDHPPPTKSVEFVDTGGFGVYVAEGERFDEVGEDLTRLTESIEFQIGQAVQTADLVLFVLDAQAGITPQDREIARMLREGRYGAARRGKGKSAAKSAVDADAGTDATKGDKAAKTSPRPGAAGPVVRVVANKVDGPKWEAHGEEVSALGFGEPLLVSAKNNYMRREFLDRVWELIPDRRAEPEPHADLKLAIIGKRNAGKSTLVNALAGEPRVIVSEIAGTTRDAIDVRFELDGKSVLAIDTAGVRRAKSFQNMVEHFAFDRAKRAIDRADVALLLVDATTKVSQVDEQVAMLCQKAHKPVIIVVNKWDLAEGAPNRKGQPVTADDFEDYLRAELKGLSFAPISFISGATGRNVRETIALAFELKEQAATRVTTGKLNRLVRTIMETRAPTDEVGTHAKVYYVAQTQVNPPTITLVVNHPRLFRPNYLRFLMNRFREELPFAEVPIRLVVRARRQREESDIAADAQSAVNVRTGVRRREKPAGRAAAGPAPEPAADRELTDVELAQFADEAALYFDDE